MKRGVRDVVNGIFNNAAAYMKYMNQIGNECAYTDSMLMNIITLADELSEKTALDPLYSAVILSLDNAQYVTSEIDCEIVTYGDISKAYVFYDKEDAQRTLEGLNNKLSDCFVLVRISREDLKNARNGNKG